MNTQQNQGVVPTNGDWVATKGFVNIARIGNAPFCKGHSILINAHLLKLIKGCSKGMFWPVKHTLFIKGEDNLFRARNNTGKGHRIPSFHKGSHVAMHDK